MRSGFRGRAAPAFALLLVLAGMELGAATLDAGSLSYLPIRYFSGDEVLIQASLFPENGEKLAELDLKPGAGLPALSRDAEIELRELKLSKTSRGWLLELRFVPWSPGSSTLLGAKLRGIGFPAIPYAALSLLGPEDRDPSPPRPQRSPPGMALFLYLLAGILVAFFLLAALFLIYLLPAARSLIARRRAALAFRRFGKSIDYLVKEAGSADPASFFAALIRALRLYLAARVLPEAPALSAPELAALPETAFPAAGTKDRAAALVARADGCRFGGEALAEAGALGLRKAAEEAREIGAANEEAILARL